MLIAIAIAEGIQGLGGSDFYNAWQSSSCIRFRFFTSSLLQFFDPPWALIAFNSRESFFLPLLFTGSTGSEPPNPWIPSAMAMAMSIYRTLCVLVRVGIRQQNGDWIEANDQPTQPIRTNLPDEDWSQSFSSQFFVHAKEVDLNLNNVASILFCFNLKPEKSYRLSPTS